MNHLYRRLADQVKHLEHKYFDAAAIHFAHAVLNTGYTLLDCDACQAALPEQIEAELNNRPGPDYRRNRRHLDLCPVCSKVYLDLVEVALLAEEGLQPPGLRDRAVPVDLSFLEPLSGENLSDV